MLEVGLIFCGGPGVLSVARVRDCLSGATVFLEPIDHCIGFWRLDDPPSPCVSGVRASARSSGKT